MNRGEGGARGLRSGENPGPRAGTPPEAPLTPCLPAPLPPRRAVIAHHPGGSPSQTDRPQDRKGSVVRRVNSGGECGAPLWGRSLGVWGRVRGAPDGAPPPATAHRGAAARVRPKRVPGRPRRRAPRPGRRGPQGAAPSPVPRASVPVADPSSSSTHCGVDQPTDRPPQAINITLGELIVAGAGPPAADAADGEPPGFIPTLNAALRKAGRKGQVRQVFAATGVEALVEGLLGPGNLDQGYGANVRPLFPQERPPRPGRSARWHVDQTGVSTSCTVHVHAAAAPGGAED